MTKLSSNICLNKPQGLRIFSRFFAAALVAAAALTANGVSARSPNAQSVSVPSTASVSAAVPKNKKSNSALKYCDAEIGTGSTNGPTEAGTVNAPTYTLGVRLSGTGDAYATSCTVGANAGGESTADIRITVTDSQNLPLAGVPAPGISVAANGAAAGVNVAAGVSLSGVSDSNGHISGTYSASDLVGATTITLAGPASGSATINQDWNDLGNTPTIADSSLYYGVPDALDYKMAIDDSNGGTVALTGHSVDYMTTAITGWKWDDDEGDYDPVSYTADADGDIDDPDAAAAATYTSGKSNGGDYPGTITLNATGNFIPDYVTFWVQDQGTYSN